MAKSITQVDPTETHAVNLKTEILQDAGTRAYQLRLENLASALKEKVEFTLDQFSGKTGAHRQRIPMNEDWPYIRAASILVKCLYTSKTVKRLRCDFGGLRRRGVKPSVRRLAGGAYIRRIVQKLENVGLLKLTMHGRCASHEGGRLIGACMKP